MYISTAKEKSFYPDLGTKEGNKIKVTFKILTAREYEKVVNEKPTDTRLFEDYVIKVENLYDEKNNTIVKDEICDLPGTAQLVNKVAIEILNSASLTEVEKN